MFENWLEIGYLGLAWLRQSGPDSCVLHLLPRTHKHVCISVSEVQESEAPPHPLAKPLPKKKKDSKPSYTTNIASVKASHMAELKSRAGIIYSAF